jgi:hypothetical protein
MHAPAATCTAAGETRYGCIWLVVVLIPPIILGPEPSVFALMIVSFILGVYLARFNILAATAATIVCAAVSLLYDLSREATLMHSLLASVGTACALQVGYLVGQLLRLPRR